MSTLLLYCSLLFSGERDTGMETWPQFRGPDGPGSYEELHLPVEFHEKQNLRWEVNIPGMGHASPVHDGAHAWLATAAPDGKSLGVVSVDLSTGSIVHQVTVFSPQSVEEIHADNSYASPTPVLRDGRLYLHFGTYGAACVDCSTGDVLWKNEEFRIEHQGGPGSSPVLFEDLMIITCDGVEEPFLAALNMETGQVVWRRPRSAPLRPRPETHRAFSTPLLVNHQGSWQLVSVGPDQCHGYDPRTGQEIWHVVYVGFSNVPRPVADDTSIYFCTGFFQPQLWAVTLGGSGNVTESHVRWKGRTTISDTPSPVIWEDQVITISDKGVMSSYYRESGERAWVFRLGGNYSSSPLVTGNKLYACSEEGLVKVVELKSDSPKILAVNRLPDGIMASPAVIGHDLLIRTTKNLYRFSLGDQ